MAIKVSKATIIQCLVFFSFFEIGLVNALENSDGSVIWYAIDKVYAVLRIFWTLYGFCIFNKRLSSSVGKSLALFLMIRMISCFINKDPYIFNIILGSFTTIGFVILCDRFIAKNFNRFVKSVYLFFGVYSLLNVISVIFLPYGVVNKDISFFGNAYSIYFLGGKNGAMFFYTVYLFSAIYLDKTKRKRTNALLLNIILIISAIMLKSANTVVSLTVVLIYQLIDRIIPFLRCVFSPKNLVSVILAFAVITLTNLRDLFYGPIIHLLNKDLTFSGRIYLWDDAIHKIIDNPFFGNGTSVQYPLILTYETRTYEQCHSLYLDYFAKYGFFTIISLIIVFAVVFFDNNATSKKDMKNLSSIYMFVMLLHSVFDDISLYFVVLICLISMALKQKKYNHIEFVNDKKIG